MIGNYKELKNYKTMISVYVKNYLSSAYYGGEAPKDKKRFLENITFMKITHTEDKKGYVLTRVNIAACSYDSNKM